MRVEYCEKDMILKVFPSTGACFRDGFTLLKENIAIFLVLILFSSVVDLPMGISEIISDPEDLSTFSEQYYNIFTFFYYLCIASPIAYGITWLFLRAVRKEKIIFEELFHAFQYFATIVIVKLLLSFVIGLGFLFLIFPGIFLLCRLVFVPYLVMDKKLSAIEAIKTSYRLSKNYFWTILSMGLLSVLIIILGLLAFGVGILFAFIWIQSAFAVLYHAVDELHYKEVCTENDSLNN